jgi:N-acyl-L-homoserine lactone synthetase
MSTVTVGTRDELGTELLRSMHLFRQDVFVRRLGWLLPQIGGVERDQYDRADTVYVTICNARGDVTACSRLLPTTGSYMLPNIFPALLGGTKPPKHPGVWEISRFATSVRATGTGRVLSLSQPTLELLESVFAHSRANNIGRLLLVTTIAIERLMLRTGLQAHRIGPPVLTNGSYCAALFIEVPSQPVDGANASSHRQSVAMSGDVHIDRVIVSADENSSVPCLS